MLSYVGKFNDVSIYESSWLGKGYSTAGLALPGIGIIVGQYSYSILKNVNLIKHEYGHFLQCKMTGKFRFYLFVGLPSLMSAFTNGFGKGHDQFWTELWANQLARSYFDSEPWSNASYPCSDISKKLKYCLTF